MKSPRRSSSSAQDRDRRLFRRLLAETLGSFLPGLGHLKAVAQRVREAETEPLRDEIAELRAQLASLIEENRLSAETIARQARVIDDLIVENERLRQAQR